MDAQELKDKIENKYGSIDSDIGCLVNGEWLSVKEIVALIDECDQD